MACPTLSANMKEEMNWKPIGIVLALTIGCLPAQPQLDLTSIKASTASRHPEVSLHQGKLSIKNACLRDLVRIAYQVRDFQVFGGPAWIVADGYDIEAKGKSDLPGSSLPHLIQSLLRNRFHLKFHRETKELPVYLLTVAKGGPRVHESRVGPCPQFKWEIGQFTSKPCTAVGGGPNQQLNHTLDAVGISISGAQGLIEFLVGNLDRMVIDKTGLRGTYDLHLEWDRRATAEILESGGPGSPPKTAIREDAGPSLFAAVEEQLGLKLESGKGPVEVLVIDHAEKPSL